MKSGSDAHLTRALYAIIQARPEHIGLEDTHDFFQEVSFRDDVQFIQPLYRKPQHSQKQHTSVRSLQGREVYRADLITLAPATVIEVKSSANHHLRESANIQLLRAAQFMQRNFPVEFRLVRVIYTGETDDSLPNLEATYFRYDGTERQIHPTSTLQTHIDLERRL